MLLKVGDEIKLTESNITDNKVLEWYRSHPSKTLKIDEVELEKDRIFVKECPYGISIQFIESTEEEYFCIGNIGKIRKNGFVEKEYSGQGDIFKSYANFVSGEGICYIPEITGRIVEDLYTPEDEGDVLSEDEIAMCYTRQDILDAVNGSEKAARILFDMLDWTHPTTLADELYKEDQQFKRMVDGDELDKVIVTIENGMVSSILSSKNLKVLVIDRDTKHERNLQVAFTSQEGIQMFATDYKFNSVDFEKITTDVELPISIFEEGELCH